MDVELCVPSVTINPSLDDIQSAIDKCAVKIIKGTQQIASWKSIVPLSDDDKKDLANDWALNHKSNLTNLARQTTSLNFYERIANDIEMVKNVIILTGAVQTLRNRVCVFALLIAVSLN